MPVGPAALCPCCFLASFLSSLLTSTLLSPSSIKQSKFSSLIYLKLLYMLMGLQEKLIKKYSILFSEVITSGVIES